jgi:hypothetical protein
VVLCRYCEEFRGPLAAILRIYRAREANSGGDAEYSSAKLSEIQRERIKEALRDAPDEDSDASDDS